MNLKTVGLLGVKELRGLLRDPIMLVLILYAFSLSIWTSANATPEALNNAAISIVDEDQSHLSSRVTASFYAPHFVPPQMITTTVMDSRMDAGLDTFALNIPPDFERDVLSGKSPAIQLNIDATRMSQAFTGGGYIQQIVSSEVSEYVSGHRGETALPVGLALRSRYNPSLDPSWFGAISSVIQSITMLSLVLTGAALIREKEHGTVEHLLVMPVTAAEIMLSKIWSMGVVVLVVSSFSLQVVVKGFLGISVAGSAALFALGTLLYLFAAASIGIFMGTVARNMPQFGLMSILVLLPLQILSGGVTPRESMPEAIQYLMSLAPTTHYVSLAQSILFRGAGIDVVWPEFLMVAVIGAVFLSLAHRRLRHAIATMQN